MAEITMPPNKHDKDKVTVVCQEKNGELIITLNEKYFIFSYPPCRFDPELPIGDTMQGKYTYTPLVNDSNVYLAFVGSKDVYVVKIETRSACPV